MDFGLKIELQHKLVMTPQLRQAIAILQLSSLELASMIEQELLENPVLEIDDVKGAGAEEAPMEYIDRQLAKYTEWAEYLASENGRDGQQADNDFSPYESMADNTISLHDHLELQMDLVSVESTVRAVGLFLIGCIDDNGYLRTSVSEAAQVLGVPESTVEQALGIIQTFDPEGVGARDLKECLVIQIRQRDLGNNLAKIVASEYLNEVAKGHYKAIAEKLGCKPHDIQLAVDYIRTLNPKPGQAFGKAKSNYIVPDITVERTNGQYIILVNDSLVPRLTISPYYCRLARESDNETKRFVEGKLNSAVWVVKSIEQRRQTLYNVTEAIIELQHDFFDYGPRFIKPMVMKKVADHLGIHESTVSRATANKYVATPHGVFSMRFFFSSGVAGVDGDDVAVAAVKREIRQMIENESSQVPYSDQAISDILKQKGINLSRRTVAKYREEMSIAASSKRRRY